MMSLSALRAELNWEEESVRTQRIVLLLLVMVLGVGLGLASAQSATTGAIAGVVKDASGAVLPGVTVEAASPALIEKVRSVVSDGSGNFKIVDLRPGTYSVTFTLPGFSTYKRDGVELSTGFTAQINGEMKVGSLEETVTVTGATPVVDIQNVRSQTVLNSAVLDSLPTSKQIAGFAALTLGVSASQPDTSGARGDVNNQLTIHGGRGDDGRAKIDGLSLQNNSGNGGGQNFVYRPNILAMQETTIETGGMSAEAETGGVQLNYVPREGGNAFKVNSSVDFANGSLQGENITDTLRSRGLTVAAGVKKIYDYGVGLGGPIAKDKIWFYTAHRMWGADEVRPGAYFNKTQNTMFYTPDLDRPAYTHVYDRDHTARVTWQITGKQKVAVSESYQDNCICWIAPSATAAPEGQPLLHFTPLSMTQLTWSYPRTNKLLVDAGYVYNYFGKKTPLDESVGPHDIGITEQSTGLTYRSSLNFPGTTTYSKDGQLNNQFNGRAAVSYVTGSHALKVGMMFYGGRDHIDRFIIDSLSYTFRNQLPVSLTQWASPLLGDTHTNNIGLYLQDQWTMNKLTLSLGVRHDHFWGNALAVDLPESRFLPALRLNELSGVPNWQDISPRLGAAYDVFGNGKTAIKGYFGRFAASMGVGFTERNSPQQSLAVSSTRTWADANGNFSPDCDLKVFTANGECGALSNQAFGTLVQTSRDGDNVREGFGKRQYTWSGTIALQQEIRPGTAFNAGFFRTSYGNLTVTDNLRAAASDFSTFCVTTPANALLPGGGNQQLCGLYDVNPNRFGQVFNETALSQDLGRITEIFNGVDLGIVSRFGKGGLINGGVSMGRIVSNICALNNLPDVQPAAVTATLTPRTDAFCGSSFTAQGTGVGGGFASQAQYKVSVVYPLPFDIQASVTYQNLPGPSIQATRAFTNAEIAPSLGRNLAACPATGNCTSTVNIVMIPADKNLAFEDRLQQLDLRFGKKFSLGKIKVQGHVDAYNILNRGAIVARNNTYGATWGRPTQIQGARLFKLGATLEF